MSTDRADDGWTSDPKIHWEGRRSVGAEVAPHSRQGSRLLPTTDPLVAVTAERVFAGPSEMAARCRAFDWASTPLGPVAGWSVALRTVAALVLASGLPNIVLWGPDLVQLYNDSYARIIQAKHPHALGRGNAEVWPEVWHLNAPIFDRVFAGETVTLEDALYPLQRRGSDAIDDAYLTISFSPIRDETGAVAGVLANMLETTGQVAVRGLQAERERLLVALQGERDRLRHAFDQAPGFVALLDGPEHRYTYVNGPYARISGHRPLVGRTVREAFPELAGQGFYELLDRAYATGEPFVGTAMAIQLQPVPGGAREERRIDLIYQPLTETGNDGLPHVVGLLVQGRDVTDAWAAEAALRAAAAERERLLDAERRARAEAEAASQAKTLFLANMSHELRTPLNAIGGYVQLLDMGLHGPVTEEQRQALARVQGAQTRLLALINDLLNYAKVESGKVEYDVRAVDVADVVDDVAPLIAPQVRAKGLVFDVRLPDTPCVVWADREKLGQVLVNLLSNAVKFTDSPNPVTGAPGRVTVSVGARASRPTSHASSKALDAAPPEALAFLRVEDTGVGIPREKQAAIFEPFVQVRARGSGPTGSYASATEGTGLGLAISRDLARGMGGDLRVRSTLGTGATFTIALRRVTDAGDNRTERHDDADQRDNRSAAVSADRTDR